MTKAAPEARHDGSRLSWSLALAGMVVLGLHTFGLLGAYDSLTFIFLVIGTIAAAVAGQVKIRPVPRWPGLVGLGALLLFFVGAVLREALGTFGDLSASRSLLPEVFTLAGYLALGIVIYGIARARLGLRWRDVNATLDAAIAGLALLALAWIYLITPSLAQQDVSLGVRLALALYPAVSIFLVTLGFRIATGWGTAPPIALQALVAALVAMHIGDILYMLVELNLMEQVRWIDVPYGIAFVACAVTVSHPSAAVISQPIPTVETTPRRGLAIVALAVCVPGLVVVARPDTATSDRFVLGIIVGALMFVSGLRVFRALLDHARSEARLTHLASHDSLTGLPNRVWVERRLTDILAERSGEDPMLAVLFMDLDRFKLVNDTLGHSMGDELLQAVARRLVNNVRPDDVVARIGGDEMVVLLTSVRSEQEALEAAERTRLSFGPAFHVGGIEIPITASVGVRFVEDPTSVDAETVLRDADTAMYAAKEGDAEVAVLFNERMHQRVTRRLALEGEVRLAAGRGELSLDYQPIVQVSDGRITGLEALLRWDHPELGRVPPADFIPVCEEIGYIVELGGWVLDEAVGHLAQLRQELDHADQLSMAVNVSVRQLRAPRFTDLVARAVLKHGVPPSSLCLEITESLLVENLTAISETLSILRGFGVRIAIDDFGTGYSSLSYLRRLPVDELKIDRQFVTGLGQDKADDSLVAAMIAMADALGFTIVAEGVENDLQRERLLALGCEHAQGYVFGAPVPTDQLPATLDRLGLAAAPRLRIIRDLA